MMFLTKTILDAVLNIQNTQIFLLQMKKRLLKKILQMIIKTKRQNIFLILFTSLLIFINARVIYFYMQQAIFNYLRSPYNHRRPEGRQDQTFAYMLTYIDQSKTMDLSYYSRSWSSNFQIMKVQKYKGVKYLLVSKLYYGNSKNRCEKFNLMTMIGSLLDYVQYHIIYLQELRYSIVKQQLLDNNGLPLCLLYFKKIKWMECQNGQTLINNRQEGKELHALIQIFIKGAGQAKNQEQIKRLQKKYEFKYNLFKTINTVCYIVGKQMLQNGFQTISCQKWVRKYSKKNFRRYDLVMRNERKSMIIDWKFTILTAIQKATFPKAKMKNEMYCQLARKDFKNQIQLRFYCIGMATQNNYYHHFTFANFEEQKLTIDLDGQISQDYCQISISDSQSEDANDLLSKGHLSRQQQINNDPSECIDLIEISSKEEIQVDHEEIQIVQSIESKEFIKGKKKKQMIWPQNFLLRQKAANTKSKVSKIQRKKEKRVFKDMIRFPIQFLEIQSD